MNKKKTIKGFTLIEILLTMGLFVLLLAMLALLMMPAIKLWHSSEAEKSAQQEIIKGLNSISQELKYSNPYSVVFASKKNIASDPDIIYYSLIGFISYDPDKVSESAASVCGAVNYHETGYDTGPSIKWKKMIIYGWYYTNSSSRDYSDNYDNKLFRLEYPLTSDDGKVRKLDNSNDVFDNIIKNVKNLTISNPVNRKTSPVKIVSRDIYDVEFSMSDFPSVNISITSETSTRTFGTSQSNLEKVKAGDRRIRSTDKGNFNRLSSELYVIPEN